ncbi:Na+/H+ antiporter NhaA [Acidiferrimicrobium sp. IK]|nr:Na+/H+ antiporter NhaA [Acidiferrimicrobium sp. IK]
MSSPTPGDPVPAPAQPRRRNAFVARLADDRVAGSGLLLAAVAALVWANWPSSGYSRFWTAHHEALNLSLRDWANQGLLVAFFAVVGLEIRREVIAGELKTLRRAVVPVVAALAGMTVPALLYTVVIAGGAGSGGWGIPTATDVAFAVAALTVVGNVGGRARMFLLTLAVADDLVAIVILVVAYNQGVKLGWLLAGAGSLGLLVGVWWTRAPVGALRVALAAVAWWSMLHAGVEACVVGAALGAWGPRRRPADGGYNPKVRRWEQRVQPLVNTVVLPVFALANIGIVLSGNLFAGADATRIFVAVVVARVLGKPLGIVAGTALGRRATRQPDAPRVSSRHLLGTGAVAGIGFTVPLLIIAAALPAGPEATAATAGLLTGSVLSVGAAASAVRLELREPWLVAVGLDVVLAGIDAALGRHVVMAGLLALGPVCAAALSRRLRPTAAVGALSAALVLVVAGPDGIWGRPALLGWAALSVTAAVASAAIVAASGPVRPVGRSEK